MLADRPAMPRLGSVRGERVLAHLDLTLIGAVVALAATSVVMVDSATRSQLQALGADPHLYLERQAVWAVLGMVAMAALAAIDYHRLQRLAPFLYGAMIVALVGVMSPIGSAAKGSQRWFPLGPLQLQPSAFASLAVILMIAAYLWRPEKMTLRHLAGALAVAAVPVGLVAVQPDLGTAIVLAVVALTMLVTAGARPRQLVVLGVVGVAAAVVMVKSGALHQYQVDRLTAFIDQSGNARQASYNLAQSKIAIAHGGLTGTGLFKGSQTNLSYVPEQRTDFIFTAIGEQLGFVGSAGVLALYAVVVWRVWAAARVAADFFGTMLCAGVLGMLTLQIFENAGMTMGIMPITGIPLPFMSYGGSSMIALCAAVGAVLSVRARRFA